MLPEPNPADTSMFSLLEPFLYSITEWANHLPAPGEDNEYLYPSLAAIAQHDSPPAPLLHLLQIGNELGMTAGRVSQSVRRLNINMG